MDRLRGAGGRIFLLRVVGPALALCVLVLGIGLVMVGPLSGPLDAEDAVNAGLAANRNGPWNLITQIWSYLGSTEVVAGLCLLVGGLVWWRTRDWRLAAVPAIAILLQLAIYLTVTALVVRARPSVDRLDVLPPLTSYPSGHVGAATALYVSFFLLTLRSERGGLRWAALIVCLVAPLLVAFARLYRGMHHVTDLIAGFGIGLACALLAYGWYVRRARL